MSVGSLVAALLLSAGPSHFELAAFLWLKASFSAVLGGAVTPFIGMVALAEPVSQTNAA